MYTFSRLANTTIRALLVSMAWTGSAIACTGGMDSFFDISIDHSVNDTEVVTARMTNFIVSTRAGQRCFIATNFPPLFAIVDVRFRGPNGGEFETFRQDAAVAAQFGPRFRAYSATALTDVDLATFTLEIDVRRPTPSIGIAQIGVGWANSAIGAGQSDPSGRLIGHASIANLRTIEILLPAD